MYLQRSLEAAWPYQVDPSAPMAEQRQQQLPCLAWRDPLSSRQKHGVRILSSHCGETAEMEPSRLVCL